MRFICLAVYVLVVVTGCSAARTTFMNVDSSGNLCPSTCDEVNGIPAMVDVPTHVEVKIIQKDFLTLSAGTTTTFTRLTGATSRRVEEKEVMTRRMVLIDPKRPCSGQGQFGLVYHGNTGTLQSVNYKAVDTTIQDTAALATAAAKLFLTAGEDKPAKPVIVQSERVIALRRFPIDPCSRPEIDAFIAEYIDNCSSDDCNATPAYANPN